MFSSMRSQSALLPSCIRMESRISLNCSRSLGYGSGGRQVRVRCRLWGPIEERGAPNQAPPFRVELNKFFVFRGF